MAYTFHTRNHGKALSIINDGKIVFKPDPKHARNAVALTSEPLRAGEAFEVLLEAVLPIERGGLEIGVTSNHPSELNIPSTMTECMKGATYMLSHKRVWKNGEQVHAMDERHSNLDFKVGDVIAVKLGSLGFVQFLRNNQCLATIPLDEDCPMYGVVDLYGRTVQVSINEGQAVNPQVHISQSSTWVAVSRKPDGAVALEDVKESVGIMIQMMLTKSPDDIEIVQSILSGLQMCTMINEEKRREVIEELLAQNAPFVFMEYISFLKLVEKVRVHFELLIFTRYLLKHSTTFNIGIGEAGLLDVCVEEVKKVNAPRMDEYQQILIATLMLVNAARRIPENITILRRLNYVRAVKPCLQSKFKTSIVIACIITCAAVMEDNEADVVKLEAKYCSKMLEWLKLAIEAHDHMHHGWHAKDLCECFTKLAASFHNLKEVVSSGGHVMFARLLKRGSSEEQEIAVKALHAHTCPQSYKMISKVPNMLDLLRDVHESWTEDTKAIAADTLKQLMTYVDSHGISSAYVPDDPSEDIEDRMVQQDKVVRSTLEDRKLPANPSPKKDFSKELAAFSIKEESASNVCPYRRECQELLDSLCLQDAYFSHNDRCFCTACHTARKVDRYSQRGRPPYKYSLPVGWCRFGLSVPPKMKALKVHMKWHKAFHGTRQKYLAKILELGELFVPGKLVLGGEHLFERSVYVDGKLRTDSKKIFVSPTIEYAAHETYAPSERYVSGKGEVYDVRVVFEIFIAPGAYKVDKQTIGLTAQIDPGFSNDEIEWTTVQQGSNVLYGLLVKMEKPA